VPGTVAGIQLATAKDGLDISVPLCLFAAMGEQTQPLFNSYWFCAKMVRVERKIKMVEVKYFFMLFYFMYA
jgi:hypothetical protein